MASVTLERIEKTYPNGFRALEPLDLSIADGEFVVIVGPSGCGKSTLLRMIAGLEAVSGGRLAIDDVDVTGTEPGKRDIAMVFQNYALYPHMKVYDNMAYGLRNRGYDKAAIDQRVKEAARILDLGALLERRPRQLSGGQRQRVAMGRAIVRHPKVFLFDEPLSNLDAKLRVQMRLEIRQLQRRLATTSVYVTHDQVEAMTLADRLVVMNGGRVEQVGTPMDLYRQPASRFVAQFIGSPAMNLLEATVAEGGEALAIGPGLSVTTDKPLPLKAGAAVALGLRPEHIHLVHEGVGLPMMVESVELLGADAYLHGRLADQPLSVRVPGTTAVGEGEQVRIRPDMASVHLFDRSSGARVTV